MKKKITTLLAILLLISLVACGSNTGDTEPTSSEPVQPTQTIEPTTEPTAEPSEEPTTTTTQESTTEPTEEPEEQIPTTKEPTPEVAQEPTTTPPATTDPPAPTHAHSYSSSVTKQATCDANGIITYTCSCGDSYTEAIKATGHNYDGGKVVKEDTCSDAGSKLFTCVKCGVVYTEAIPANGNHTWATRHVDEVGHTESNGTHIVRRHVCACGNFEVWSDDPEFKAKYNAHYDPFNNGCTRASTVWEVEKPNNPTWVVDVPAHDEVYCTSCGLIQ